MKLSIFLTMLIAFTAAANSYALSRCESQFRRGLLETKELFQRLSPACAAQVAKGSSNRAAAKAVCKNDESDKNNALAMENIKSSRLKVLCQDSSCTRLKARGVCVDNKSLQYYFSKFGI